MLLEQRFNNEGSITRVEQTFFLENNLVHIPDQGTLIDMLDGLPLYKLSRAVFTLEDIF